MSGAVAGPPTHWWSTRPPRTDTPPISAVRAYGEVLLVFGAFFAAGIAAAGFDLAGQGPGNSTTTWGDAVPVSIELVFETALCVLVPLLLVTRRGGRAGDLGIARPGMVSLPVGLRAAAWAVLALIAGSIVTAALATGRYPVGNLSAPDLVVDLVGGAQAGFIEEIVVLAFVVTTLEQARRPRREIVAVALLLRASYHIYYGPGVFGIFVWASVFVWLFLRLRTIVPLIAVHSSWDVLIFLDDKWHAVAIVQFLLLVALLITSVVLWLVERSTRARATPYRPQLAAPGWYPDPGGAPAWRWFDGWTWTAHTYPLDPTRNAS